MTLYKQWVNADLAAGKGGIYGQGGMLAPTDEEQIQFAHGLLVVQSVAGPQRSEVA